MKQEMAKEIAPKSQKSPLSLRLVFLFLFLYGLMHLNPQVASVSTLYNLNPLGPQIVLAQEDDEEEEEEDDEGEEEDEEEASDEEEGGEEGEEGAEGEPEEDLSYLTDIGPAKEIVNEPFTFPGMGNRKATWFAAQLHILFASFILGCPMFVVIMEVMGARRTPGVRKAIILSNVFLGILIGVTFGIIGEIIVAIEGGVMYGLIACSVGGLVVSFLNYFHKCKNV